MQTIGRRRGTGREELDPRPSANSDATAPASGGGGSGDILRQARYQTYLSERGLGRALPQVAATANVARRIDAPSPRMEREASAPTPPPAPNMSHAAAAPNAPAPQPRRRLWPFGGGGAGANTNEASYASAPTETVSEPHTRRPRRSGRAAAPTRQPRSGALNEYARRQNQRQRGTSIRQFLSAIILILILLGLLYLVVRFIVFGEPRVQLQFGLTEEEVFEFETLLSDQAFFVSTPDTLIDEETQQAVLDFTSFVGLEPTSDPSPELLQLLRDLTP